MTKLVVEQNCQVRTPTKLEEQMINKKIEQEYAADVSKVINVISDQPTFTLTKIEADVYEHLRKVADPKNARVIAARKIVRKNFGASHLQVIQRLIKKGLLKRISPTQFGGKRGCEWLVVFHTYEISSRSRIEVKKQQTPQKTFSIDEWQKKIQEKITDLDERIDGKVRLVEALMMESKQLQEAKKELETALKVISSLK